MTNPLTRLIRWLGLGKLPAPFTPQEGAAICDDIDRRLVAHVKNQRLAAIARERNELKDLLAKAKRQKKAYLKYEWALSALKVEEIQLAGDLP